MNEHHDREDEDTRLVCHANPVPRLANSVFFGYGEQTAVVENTSNVRNLNRAAEPAVAIRVTRPAIRSSFRGRIADG